jgi:hypothetical protein
MSWASLFYVGVSVTVHVGSCIHCLFLLLLFAHLLWGINSCSPSHLLTVHVGPTYTVYFFFFFSYFFNSSLSRRSVARPGASIKWTWNISSTQRHNSVSPEAVGLESLMRQIDNHLHTRASTDYILATSSAYSEVFPHYVFFIGVRQAYWKSSARIFFSLINTGVPFCLF